MKTNARLFDEFFVCLLLIIYIESYNIEQLASHTTMKMNEGQFAEILNQHSVRKTETRLQVLEVFFKHEHALAHSDIERELGELFDRVTLYRTLHTFEQAGIIHEVPSTGENKFALYHTLEDKEQHIHFTCNVCKQTYCLENPINPKVEYIGDFDISSFNINAVGVCKNCKGLN